jgi:hypothetical protein
MKFILSVRFATLGLITLLVLIILFHALALTGIIPYNMLWGGRLKSVNEMYTFEIISVLINLIMLLIVLIYAGYIKIKVNALLLKTTLWIMAGLFLLNTLGNLTSLNQTEKLIFTPLTLLLFLLSMRLAWNNAGKTNK